MKKIMIVCLSVFLLCACSGNTATKKPVELSAQNVIDKLADKKQNSFLLYLTTENCYTCDEYEKVVNELLKEDPFDIYYVSIDLNEDDAKVVAALNELNITNGNFTELPMTFYFYQGALLPENKKAGYIEKDDYREWLKGLHLMK